MPGTKKPVSVLVLIHTPNLEVLLLERTAHPGFWQSVTGSQEGDESLCHTACREVFEETGIRMTSGQLHDWKTINRYEIFLEWRYRYPEGVTHNHEHVYSLCVPHATPVTLHATEHKDQCWLPWKEAASRVFSWSNRDAILMLPLLRR